MSEEESSLRQRVDQLEEQVSRLQDELRDLREKPPRKGLLGGEAKGAESGEELDDGGEVSVRDWIDKVGIGLLLIGVVFFLKYSYDQGWLTEFARVLVGTGIGAALLATGAWLRESKRHLSAVLSGGGIATFYGVIYTAHAFYGFISFPVAFVLMQGVTVAGCLLAIRQDYAVLGSLAAIGAFATPFALYDVETGPVLLAIYATIAGLGLLTIYLLRGWRSVLLTTSAGAWAVFLVAQIELAADAAILDMSLIVASIAVLAVAMLIVLAISPRFHGRKFGEFEALHTLMSALVAVILVHELFEPRSAALVGFIAAFSVLTYGFTHIINSKRKRARHALLVTSLGLAALAVALLLEINFYALILLVIGVSANFFSKSDRGPTRIVGLVAMGALAIWSLVLRFQSIEGLPFLNPLGLQLILTAAGIFIVGRTFEARTIQWSHYWTSLAAVLWIIVHQLQDLTHSEIISTSVWGSIALAMLVYGMLTEHRLIQLMGLATVVATATKLLIFDLDAVDPLWRMALFMGIGLAILLLSAVTSKYRSEDR